jgi:K+-sensing histidine kinase KdpD
MNANVASATWSRTLLGMAGMAWRGPRIPRRGSTPGATGAAWSPARTLVAHARGRAKVEVMNDTATTRFPTMGALFRLPAAAGLRKRRRWSGVALTAAALPLLTAMLVPLRDTLGPESALLLYLLVVVVVAVVGGIWPAAVASVAALLLANFFFTSPFHTLVVSERDSLIALVVFLLVAATVSITVDLAIRNRVAAARSSTEASMLSRFTAEPVGDVSVQSVLEQVHHAFGLHAVALLHHDGDHEQVVAAAGPPVGAELSVSVAAGGGLRLVADGKRLSGEDRRLLGRLASTAARVWEGQQLAEQAARARELAEIDRLRTILLAAVGHDLRTPLAGIKAAVTSLQQHDVTWSPADQDELLATIEESADRLDDLIANLLAMSRLQAGAMSAVPTPVALDEVVARALISLHRDNVVVDVPDDLPLVNADAGLLERAIANVVTNACQFSPEGQPVGIHAHADPLNLVRLTVSDSGPGVPATDWERMFTPFQRLGETSDGGHGLGLAIARGFTEATGVTLTPAETPGGGLTMTFTLPAAP